jgi:hypothetical protein
MSLRKFHLPFFLGGSGMPFSKII